MTTAQPASPAGVLLPLLAMLGAMAGFQVGASFAMQLFPAVGPLGAATLRLVLGSAMLIALARPWRTFPRGAPLGPLLGVGVATAAAMTFFYLSIDRLPQGVAVSLQFLGPLTIAIVGSRRPVDLLWAGLAAGSVWLLVGIGSFGRPLDPVGLLFALGAAAGWGAYIVFGRAAGQLYGPSTASMAAGIAALVVLPFGAVGVGQGLLKVSILPLAVLVALLSTALPFMLEFYALRRMPVRTFAVFTSLEPAIGVLSAFVLMQQSLTALQMGGVALVMLAAGGAAWTSGERTPPDIT